MPELKIFKIEYTWYEGEHCENLLGKDVSTDEFERDLVKAKEFAESLIGKEIKFGESFLGKWYSVECLPVFYEKILWHLTEKLGYLHCHYDENVAYDIDDWPEKKIHITQLKKKIEKKEVKNGGT